MQATGFNQATGFHWSIAKVTPSDFMVPAKYRVVILPMTALQRLITVLEDNKHAVLDMAIRADRGDNK